MAERKGLTAPANAAEELKRIMQEEANEATKPPSLEDGKAGSNEGSFPPSLETAQEDRKETSYQGNREGWKEAVKARAKAGDKESRKVRLNVDIPADIHLQMKLWCLKEGYNLNEVIPALVAQFLEGEKE